MLKMAQAPLLTGQDIAEAQGAVTQVLEHALAETGTSRYEYVILRVLTVRGPFAAPKELHEFLAGQQQLGLTPEAVADVLDRLEAAGLAAGTAYDGTGPAEATPTGAALLSELTEKVTPTTRDLFSGLDADDLATAHRVLIQVTERAGQILASA
jgi:DNA-binding MarR family transcriptional regulator